MASAHPKISDEEMRFFQFKAKQLCDKVKEEEAWLKHCSELTHEGCSECDKRAAEFKTVGVQVAPKKSVATSATPSNRNAQKEAAVEELRNRLEKIELELEKIYGTSIRNAQRKLCEGVVNRLPEYLSPEEEEIFIKGGLKSCIAKINDLLPEKLKKPTPSVKRVNSGYVLPHDLQKKRESARKAYLASLNVPNTKKTETSDSKKNVAAMKKSETKQVLPKAALKCSNQAKVKSKLKTNPVEEENTLIQTSEDNEINDPHIELVVDGILDDLLREAVVDLNKIKYFGTIFQVLEPKNLVNQTEPTAQSQNQVVKKKSLPTTVNNHQKLNYNIDSAQSLQYKYLFETHNKLNSGTRRKSEINRNFLNDTALTGTLKKFTENFSETYTNMFNNCEEASPVNAAPKFTCSIIHTLSVDPAKAKDIAQHTEEFRKYLTRINHVVTDKFNPWALCNAIADSIVDDCIDDVAEDLCLIPSLLIKFLYNQEFLQQVDSQN